MKKILPFFGFVMLIFSIFLVTGCEKEIESEALKFWKSGEYDYASIGVIKGDNDYLYVKAFIRSAPTSQDTTLYVYDSDGKAMFSRTMNKDSRSIDKVDESCPRSSKYNDSYDKYIGDWGMYFFEGDTLYYIEDSGTCEDTIGTEYKVTFKNNEAVTEKIGEYKIEVSGAC